MSTDAVKLGTKARKFAVALVGAIGIVISTGLVPADIVAYANAGVAFLTALGVYVVPNDPVS